MKRKIKRLRYLSYTSSAKTKRASFLKVRKSFVPSFDFKATYTSRRAVVKKNEVKSLLLYRLFYYFSLVQNPLHYKKTLSRSKFLSSSGLSFFEFRLITCLLRANFFENGYVISSLAKRHVFLINGALVINPTSSLKV